MIILVERDFGTAEFSLKSDASLSEFLEFMHQALLAESFSYVTNLTAETKDGTTFSSKEEV